MADERDLAMKKFNRQTKQEPKTHSQVVYRPLGLAPWNRTKSKKRKNKEIADVVKRARR
jgi:hypothetical protein